MANPANPEAALDALLAGRSAPEPLPSDRPLMWSLQAQVEAASPSDAEQFEVSTTLSDGTVVSTGFGFRFGGVAVSRRAAA